MNTLWVPAGTPAILLNHRLTTVSASSSGQKAVSSTRNGRAAIRANLIGWRKVSSLGSDSPISRLNGARMNGARYEVWGPN